MIFGSYVLALATIAIFISAIGYFFVARGNQAYMVTSRWFFYLGVGLVVAASVNLLTLFLGDRFEFAYVSGYSSHDLATNFKVTSFWAGQEGSFLLWALFGVLLGLWVRVKAKEQLGWVMFFYLVSVLFLFALMNISSPFRLNHVIPPDGNGLNPLLQNYWMQIHPPVVFLGYASTFVPFAFAMAALAGNKYDRWMRLAFPWAIFSVCTLGLGIFLGGYWAYETLGWGGYWGWDPVENASLVPWLGSIALVHGMILERHKGTFRKTNLFLAITTFLMVIYGTFLTRSGVLADFSVHSFVDLGMTGYLVLFLVGFSVISYGMLIFRGRHIESNTSGKSIFTLEFSVYLGMLFIILSAFLVLLGTSSPILTRLFGDASSVDISYYVKTNLPIGILIGIVLGLTGVLSWGSSSRHELFRKLPLPIIAAMVITLIAIIMGITDIAHIFFIFTSAFAFAANLVSLVNRIRSKGYFIIHSDLIHVGLGIMFIGVVASSGYPTEVKTTLELDKPAEILNFTMTYTGVTPISDTREQANLKIEKGNTSFMANPVFVWSHQGLVRNPYIKKYLLYDLYISPEEVKTISTGDSSTTFILSRGQVEEFEGYRISFDGFKASSHEQNNEMVIGAVMNVTLPGGSKSRIKPEYIVPESQVPELKPALLPGSDWNCYLLKLNADDEMIMLGITRAETADEFKPSELFILNVARRPLINFVWFGISLMILGSAIGTYRRLKEIK